MKIELTREEAKQWIENLIKTMREETSGNFPDVAYKDEVYVALEMAIKEFEQKPKIGHWIKTNDYFTGAYSTIDYVQCSECGMDSLEEGDFCPNCGVKMESKDEEWN